MEQECKATLRIAAKIVKEAERNGFLNSKTEKEEDKLPTWLNIYDLLITDEHLVTATRKLFVNGHYSMAVEQAYKYINNLVKKCSGCPADGAELMKTVFSPKNPRLALNQLQTRSQKDQQLGYMEIFAGCMTGIRNPRAHEHEYMDEPEVALEMLAWSNHLARLVKQANSVWNKSE